MTRWLCGFLIALLTVSVLGTLQAQPKSGRPEALPSLVIHYLDTADGEEADRLRHEILSHSDASIDRVAHIIQTERTYQRQPIGQLPDERIRVHGSTYSLAISIPLTYEPRKAYGLVLCLHGAGFGGDAYLERWKPRLGDEYLLACPSYTGGAWFTRQAEEVVLATIQAMQRRYHVDPDRIFLTGMSNGGIGTWLIGMHHAPLFAGVAPMASGLDDVLMPFLANLRNTPVYIIHGAKDRVMPVELSRAISRELTALGYPYVYREHEREHPMAGGHYFPREELPDLVAWLNKQRRNPSPTTLRLVREASHFQPFGWIRIDGTDQIAAFAEDLISKRDALTKTKQYAKLEASIVSPNRIEVDTKRIQRYSLFLNRELIDLSKPLTVLTNGQVSFEGRVTPSLDTLLTQARLRQDPGQLYPVQVTISVKKPTP